MYVKYDKNRLYVIQLFENAYCQYPTEHRQWLSAIYGYVFFLHVWFAVQYEWEGLDLSC